MATFSARVLLLGFLCGSAPSSATAQTTRDSAGIRIVENATPAWAAGQGWKLSPKPIMDIGSGGDKDHEFGRITGVTRLSDGRLVVADASTLQLKFYDATGHHIKSVGGKGGGPGEFTGFVALKKLPGDSIAVDALRTTSIFTPTGTYVRSVSFGPFPEGVMQSPFVGTLGRFDNGTTVVMDFPQGQRKPAGAEQWIDSSTLFLVNAGGAVIRPLGKMPVVTFVAGTMQPSPLDFGPEAHYASSRRSMFLGFSNEFAIGVYNADWKLERIIRRAWTPRPFSTAEHDTYVDGWMKMWSKKTGVERDAERKEMRSERYPKTLPAYGKLLVTAAGEVWVREPDLTGAPGCWCVAGIPTVPSRWSVFDAGGRWLGDVLMPSRFVPLEIGADYVLGRALDADDVPHAVMYTIEKGR